MNKKIEATALNGKQLLKNGDEMNIRMGTSDMEMEQMTVDMINNQPVWPALP